MMKRQEKIISFAKFNYNYIFFLIFGRARLVSVLCWFFITSVILFEIPGEKFCSPTKSFLFKKCLFEFYSTIRRLVFFHPPESTFSKMKISEPHTHTKKGKAISHQSVTSFQLLVLVRTWNEESSLLLLAGQGKNEGFWLMLWVFTRCYSSIEECSHI